MAESNQITLDYRVKLIRSIIKIEIQSIPGKIKPTEKISGIRKWWKNTLKGERKEY